MPVPGRHRVLISCQQGSTLVELMVTIPFALIVALASLHTFGQASEGQKRVETRAHAVMDTQVALERMTRELRQATWVSFRTSQIAEMNTFVRPGSSGVAVQRFVRYDCSARALNVNGRDIGGRCVRLEGSPVAYPPPVNAPAARTHTLIDGFQGLDVFHPQSVDPVTGQTRADYLKPTLLTIRMKVKAGDGRRVVEVRDGVSLRNATRFAR